MTDTITITGERRYAAQYRPRGSDAWYTSPRVTDAATAAEEAYGWSTRGRRPVRVIDVETGDSFPPGDVARAMLANYGGGGRS